LGSSRGGPKQIEIIILIIIFVSLYILREHIGMLLPQNSLLLGNIQFSPLAEGDWSWDNPGYTLRFAQKASSLKALYAYAPWDSPLLIGIVGFRSLPDEFVGYVTFFSIFSSLDV
jgi:hypothetical protein